MPLFPHTNKRAENLQTRHCNTGFHKINSCVTCEPPHGSSVQWLVVICQKKTDMLA